ncbi:hypothetical protein K0A96_02360 [Patescibacteria group bacterium]|nr:hypothetical protein [Patescibacteria group bacterium]
MFEQGEFDFLKRKSVMSDIYRGPQKSTDFRGGVKSRLFDGFAPLFPQKVEKKDFET